LLAGSVKEVIFMNKELIGYLKKDRKVNKTFIEKLEKVGFEVEYGKYGYWDNQDYVRIGRQKVWLVCEKRDGNSSYVDYRYQNNVISDIYEALAEEKQKAEKADQQVEEFFQKLGENKELPIEQKIANWLDEVREENEEEQKTGTFEKDDNYLEKINQTWEKVSQFIPNDSELIQKYTACHASFFPVKVNENYDGDLG
jgi:uncharacterized coiled-coil protein SlyX